MPGHPFSIFWKSFRTIEGKRDSPGRTTEIFMWQRVLVCLVVAMTCTAEVSAGTYPPNGEIVLTDFPVIPDGILLAGGNKQHIGTARFTATTLYHRIQTLTVDVLDERGAFVTQANPVIKVEVEYINRSGLVESGRGYVDANGKATINWRFRNGQKPSEQDPKSSSPSSSGWAEDGHGSPGPPRVWARSLFHARRD